MASTAYSDSEWDIPDNSSQDSFESFRSLESTYEPEEHESDVEKNEASSEDDGEVSGADSGEEEAIEVDVEVQHKLPGNMKPLLQKRLSLEESNILMNGKAQWMGCKGQARKKVFLTMASQLRKLAGVKDLTPEEWEARQTTYKVWLANNTRGGANHSRIKVGRSWTARSVIQEQKKERINRILEEKYQSKPGSEGALKFYQRAVSQVIKELSAEEKTQAEMTAAAWNLERGPSDNVKARNAGRHGIKMFREFAQEMWRACGMRIVSLAGWKDEGGEIVTVPMDFNDQIRGGEKFDHIKDIMKDWEQYIGATMGEGEGLPSSQDESTNGEVRTIKAKKSRKKQREDIVKAVMREDGSIWIGEIDGLSREVLQTRVRGFFTAHYRKTCGKENVVVPFKKMRRNGHDMIAERHLPTDFEFPDDPSHMRISEAKAFLDFIRKRQRRHPDDVFEFHHWLNDDGELEEPRVVEQENEDAEQPRRRKGKGKGGRRKAPQQSEASNVEGRSTTSRHARSKRGKVRKAKRDSSADREADTEIDDSGEKLKEPGVQHVGNNITASGSLSELDGGVREERSVGTRKGKERENTDGRSNHKDKRTSTSHPNKEIPNKGKKQRDKNMIPFVIPQENEATAELSESHDIAPLQSMSTSAHGIHQGIHQKNPQHQRPKPKVKRIMVPVNMGSDYESDGAALTVERSVFGSPTDTLMNHEGQGLPEPSTGKELIQNIEAPQEAQRVPHHGKSSAGKRKREAAGLSELAENVALSHQPSQSQHNGAEKHKGTRPGVLESGVPIPAPTTHDSQDKRQGIPAETHLRVDSHGPQKRSKQVNRADRAEMPGHDTSQRRSGRARKAPLPPDSNVPTPERVNQHKPRSSTTTPKKAA